MATKEFRRSAAGDEERARVGRAALSGVAGGAAAELDQLGSSDGRWRWSRCWRPASSYYASRFNRIALVGAILGLAVNWFGDSLDGTLARVRGHQRPRYGFYVDHVVDCFGVLFVVSGLALSGYMSPLVATGLLIAYFMLSIEVYLATYCLTVFRMSFWGIGPTELRILLAIGTLALWSDPRPEIFGQQYRLFDVGGVVAIVSLAVTLVVSVARNTRALYLAEPLPGRSEDRRRYDRAVV